MKPILLEFNGFNSFSERAVIDFLPLSEYGIFGIFGDTGSGKSTVLDCMIFALYGDVSRSRPKDASKADIVNYRSEKATVCFEFSVVFEGRRRVFRAEREIRRKNAVQSARVYEREGDRLLALAEGVSESNALLLRIVGLGQQDFERCIALPQGEFAQFVKAAKGERLRLVSRLFDLERYGEGLVKRTNAAYARLRGETDVLQARLEAYEGVTEEGNRALKREIRRLASEEEAHQKTLERLRSEEKRLTALYEKRREAEGLSAERKTLEERRGAMAELEGGLNRLDSSSAALTAQRELREAEGNRRLAAAALEKEKAKLTRALQRTEALSSWDGERAEAEINRLTELCAACKNAEVFRAQYREAERELEIVQKKQGAERALFAGFSYGEEREKLDARRKALGEEDFFSYAEKHGKAALLRGEYAQFAGELRALTRKYPVIEPDSAPLAARYEALSAGEKTDFSRIRASFEKRERERKALDGELLRLEQRKGKYDVHLNLLQTLETKRSELKKRMQELLPRFEGTPAPEEAERRLKEKREEKRATEALIEEARKARAEAETALAAATERLRAAEDGVKSAEKRADAALAAGGFSSAEEARALAEKYGDPAAARAKLEEYKNRLAAVSARLKELSGEDYSAATETALAELRGELPRTEEASRECSKKLAVALSGYEAAEKKLAEKKEREAEYAKKRGECAVCERLKKLLEGNKFMEFAAEEHLCTVAENASGRLLSLTDGRYFLRYEGAGFSVGDNFNGGKTRGVHTLSGGETFLVSLSLALALGAEICLRSMRPIEFFFLDEGFGTLDDKLVDTVVDSLEKLKGEHFTIGVISHVEELKHRIERKLTVKKATEKHGSQIQAE